MDCETIIEHLLGCDDLTDLLGTGDAGEPAIYQLVAPKAETLPRLAVSEAGRYYTRWADNMPTQECVRVRVDIFCAGNQLRAINAALDAAMRQLWIYPGGDTPDDYLQDQGGLFAKAVTYDCYVDLD